MLRLSDNPPILHAGSGVTIEESRLCDLSGRWWVAHTKSRCEKAFAWEMVEHGIGYFLPLIERVRMSGGRKRHVLWPLFPGYVFLCGEDADRLTAMRTNRLCQTIDVPDQAALVDQMTGIETALLTDMQLDPYPHLAVGRRCRINSGPFEGQTGIVLDRGRLPRIVLEISVLGVGAAMEIDADLLEEVSGF